MNDFEMGDLVSKRKEELRWALEEQIELGEEELAKENKYLLDINLDDLDNSLGEDQAIWLLISAAGSTSK